MTDSDLRATLNLPKTDFPMKANLPQAEPRRLEQWKADGLYGRIRRARSGQPGFVLHDGPPYANGHIHLGTVLNKILKDVIVRSRSMSGKDAPYRPGWDCHGLPIELKVDRDLGREEARDVADRVPPRLPRLRGEVRRHPAQGVRAPGRPRRVGRPLSDDVPALPGDDRPPAGRLRRAGARLQGQEVRALVHLVPHGPRRGRGRVRRAPRQPVDRRALPARRAEVAKLAARHPALAGKRVFAVIWTTTPWTLPANLALAFHPDADYAFYPVPGTQDVLLLAKALREASEARWHAKGNPAAAPPRSGRRSPRRRARTSSTCASAIPGSTATRPLCSPTTSRSTPAPASSTPRPATAGTTT